MIAASISCTYPVGIQKVDSGNPRSDFTFGTI